MITVVQVTDKVVFQFVTMAFISHLRASLFEDCGSRSGSGLVLVHPLFLFVHISSKRGGESHQLFQEMQVIVIMFLHAYQHNLVTVAVYYF